MEEDLTHVSQYFPPVRFALCCSQLSSIIAHSYWQVEYIITGVVLLSASQPGRMLLWSNDKRRVSFLIS